MSLLNIDKRICELIKKCMSLKHRSMFFILGETYQNKVVMLYHLLVKYRMSSNMSRPTPLWCYKKDLGFNSFHNKKLKKMKKNHQNNSLKSEDIFEHFLLCSNIQVCHYSDSDKILGQTFGLLVLQDFIALTPNTLARLIECVEGGGIIAFLLPDMSSLDDLFSLHLEAHSRFVTESHIEVTPLFNKRFVLSLLTCQSCLVLDNSFNVKLIPHQCYDSRTPEKDKTLDKGLEYFSMTSNLGKILSLCCTTDQSEALKRLSDALKDHQGDLHQVSSLISARGRGKSAVLGLAISLALDLQLCNIFLTSPHLENVQTLFSFLIKGLLRLGFEEDKDFRTLYNCSNNVSFISGVRMIHRRKQTVTYLSPLDFQKIGNADLVVMDEAAAIPSHIVRRWLGPFNVFMASTINGYEGTGRSLSLKLINEIRAASLNGNKEKESENVYSLLEISLGEAVRYSEGDPVERWLNDLLCLDAAPQPLLGTELPPAEQCRLYEVCKEALFSSGRCAEEFLQRIVSLFVTSHYKNSPNDLLMMADAPAHRLFCLLPPLPPDSRLPNVLCVLQVALEGRISEENYNHEQSHGRRASGDLIPWIISQQFQSENFTKMEGARVVRIATHPDCQKMGYGRRALQLLCEFYGRRATEGEKEKSSEETVSRNSASPLLHDVSEMAQPLDYVGVSYGLTAELLKFWKRSGFVPLYIRQNKSEVTGEHSCLMVKSDKSPEWLSDFYADFTNRFVSLLPTAFSSFSGSLALSVLHCKHLRPRKGVSAREVQWFLGLQQLTRLDAYCNNLIDYHLVQDLLPSVSRLYFCGHLDAHFLSSLQEVVLLCMGLQGKPVERTAVELKMEAQQVMGCFRKAVKKITSHLKSLFQTEITSE